MNREDVLRELELLPVWQLRAPSIKQTSAGEGACATKPYETPINDIEAASALVAQAPSPASNAATLEFIISDDKKWCFISQNGMPATPMDIGLQGILFKNILLALKIEKTNKITLENMSEAKVIIAMGETAAQELLKTTESLEQLRGKTHSYQNIPLIVTYHPNDMLQHLPNKAKTWDDLCMAFQLMDA